MACAGSSLLPRGRSGQSLLCQVCVAPHQVQNLAELLQVSSLGGTKRHCFEEGHDPLLEVEPPANAPAKDVFAVVVTPGIAEIAPALEELAQELQRRQAPLALRDDEFRPDLPARLQRRTPVDVDAEAAFAVDETGDPAL